MREGWFWGGVELPDTHYIPPGRFLYGSGAEDSLRRGFFHAVPVHAVETGAYLIARHETTFAEWMTYLRSLPPRARRARFPNVGRGGFEGSLTFTEPAPGSFALTLQPTTQAYHARLGEKIHYQGRTQRVEQDWERFPVVGISVEDAKAYVDWLKGSGRVPGARLCTEQEWERAARGADGRDYPHGNALQADQANFDETYGKVPAAMGPDTVGSYPVSRSPFGLEDMAGNVWEWTVSSVLANEHAARGGSYYFDINSSRTSNRETPEPSFRDVSVGMRVCADVGAR